ncbi:MAG: hypothetical protein JO136_22000, partial [Hyphomicrobiales bacterium]|nr:hypothetical protein [Hyphomicrobiales bacterium]MBV9910765.1 hypothetical protein [Hyphomicrobiales bacterium]
QVLGAGAPIASSAVTLWAASAGAATQLSQSQTDADGRFTLSLDGKGADLYVTAQGGRVATKASGDNPAIALMAVLGTTPPDKVVVNEMTTVASVWTQAQFLDGTAIKGPALSLKIAADNVPSFVDLATGGWGEAILSPLNGGQTPTMANFATSADALSGCVVRVADDACAKLFVAATPPKGAVPTDTLTAADAIARYPWYLPKRVFALLDEFYPISPGKTMRAVPFMPYLGFAPSAWVLPLRFDGGGYRAGGKAMFDSEGNLWIGDNFTVGWQGQDALWQGNAPSSLPTESRSRRARPASPAAVCKAAPSAPRSTRTTTPGSRATAASRLPCSTRRASRSLRPKA